MTEGGRGISVSLVLGCLSSWFDSHAIAPVFMIDTSVDFVMGVTQWGSFLRRGVLNTFFESVAYGKAAFEINVVLMQKPCRRGRTLFNFTSENIAMSLA